MGSAVEPDGRLREGMPLPAFAGLKCLDSGSLEHLDGSPDAGVEFSWNRKGRSALLVRSPEVYSFAIAGRCRLLHVH
jgi:hypothetical protein